MLKIWYPPLSVSIGPLQPVNFWRPPCPEGGGKGGREGGREGGSGEIFGRREGGREGGRGEIW